MLIVGNLLRNIAWRSIGLMSKKWSNKTQAYYLMTCAELLAEGFVMHEALQFLMLMMPKQKAALIYVSQMLQQGKRFDETLHKLSFKPTMIAQLYLAQENGNFIQVLRTCGQELEKRYLQFKKLRSLLVYPSVLLSFILILLFSIRQFFLPQLMQLSTEENQLTLLTVFMIKELPSIVVGLIVSVGLLIGIVKLMYQRRTALEKIIFLSRLQPLRKWITLYYTAYFSRELAYFYENGYSLTQMVTLLKNSSPSALLQEFARFIEANAQAGRPLHDMIGQLTFLKKEMIYIIQHGQKVSQLPLKLKLFSQDCFVRLEKDIELKLTLIQPIMFLIVGVIVVLVYIILMLPMLSLVDTLFV